MSETNTQNQQNNQQNTQTQQGNQQGGSQQNQTAPAFDYDKLAGIINGKQRADEETILKNYFKNQGLSSDEMKQAIAAFKDQKAKNTPDVGKLQSDLSTAQSDLVKERLNTAAMKEALKQGVPMESVDYLLRMADLNNVTDENGKVKEDALTEAVKKVLEDVPALKGTRQSGGNGFNRIGGDGTQSDGVDDDMLRGIFGVRKK
ncbi:MAG: hypothetical protein II163_06615 [Ruminococcus sp.]|nr:hypothetical protein [Ruminococcus sp.]